jgi:hypothetical protein
MLKIESGDIFNEEVMVRVTDDTHLVVPWT